MIEKVNMCSFFSINRLLENKAIVYLNRFSKLRGPDETCIEQFNGHTFVHNLLSITGEYTTQPLFNSRRDIVCLYNGEIYNSAEFGEYKSDGEVLIPLYEKYGSSFIQKLDGEFAIVLYDFKKKIIIASTDIFATKPLWMSVEDDRVGFASYESCLLRAGFSTRGIRKIAANKTYIMQLNGSPLSEKKVYSFDISNQHKKTYDDWISSYEKSIEKRVRNCKENIFIGLSSGYDSMTIAHALKKQKIKFKSYSIYARENYELLEQRQKLMPDGTLIRLTKKDFEETKNKLKKDCEEFMYQTSMNRGPMTEDKGAVGMYYICDLARQAGCKILLSGQGADEVYSDYGHAGLKLSSVSGLAGDFPDDLTTCFPWKNFYGGTQISYLAKEEHVAGIFGIEARYPFLDKEVVQEFFWLDKKLKNIYYKAPLHEYLTRNKIPFEEKVKIGFSANANLI